VTGHEHYLREAIGLAHANMKTGGRPFGAVVVKNGAIIATGVNEILRTNDPTAHAELTAIRAASRRLGSPSLIGCAVYASGNPCPMCMAAMRMAGVNEVYFAYSNDDGAPYGLSTAAIHAELAKPFSEQSMKISYIPTRLESGIDLYEEWKKRQHETQMKNPPGR
jgi:tRNA(Arg) A34 adenosine deaminase TadA